MTLQNLFKEAQYKPKEQFTKEMLAIRKYLKEEKKLEWNEEVEKDRVSKLLDKVYNTKKKSQDVGTKMGRGGYTLLKNRPKRIAEL